MIDVSGHWRNSRCNLGYSDNAHPLIVNCCGWQKFKTKDALHNRPEGRLDYQIIYVHRGSARFFRNGGWISLCAGNIVFFRPHEPQVYSYHAADRPEVYWLHFTGSDAETLAEKYRIASGHIGESASLPGLFKDIITELQHKKNGYEDMVLNSFHRILMTICRHGQNASSPPESHYTIERLILQLNLQYMDKWTISSMAGYCKLSEGYFSHSFKQHTGKPPIHFLNELRIEKAKDLLLASSMNVSAIASLVGFSDPLYFSRVFKKAAGVAPQDFQRRMMKSNTPAWQ